MILITLELINIERPVRINSFFWLYTVTVLLWLLWESRIENKHNSLFHVGETKFQKLDVIATFPNKC